MKHVLLGAFCCCLLSWGNASGQSQPDSILTTKGAVTLITCGSAISTFQIGDGKNSDYDYRIVDGNVVFIRPVVANPKPTNLVIREGDNIFYMILAFRDKVELTKLKYNLSGSKQASRSTAAATQADAAVEEDTATVPDIDTVTVSNIASDFIQQRKVNHQYETSSDNITVTYAQAMSLNNLVYLCYKVKNHSNTPYQIAKVTLMHKIHEDTASLHHMPVLYKKGPSLIGGRDEQNIVYVVAAPVFKKNDEIILIIYNGANQNQVVLYTPVSGLPKYMITR